jgi:hypothetical protein
MPPRQNPYPFPAQRSLQIEENTRKLSNLVYSNDQHFGVEQLVDYDEDEFQVLDNPRAKLAITVLVSKEILVLLRIYLRL